jgi:NADP-dependent 3-hydroxy acid dehydrogenase YdfG
MATSTPNRSFGLVTGDSSGIGLELDKCYDGNGHELLLAADELEIESAADQTRAAGGRRLAL